MSYEIPDGNRTHGKAEMDLPAFKDKVALFTECKAQTGNAFGEPENFADNRKKKLLAEAAD